MADLGFTWDETKARANAKKHGVSFDEAQSAFSDERARIIDDPDHSDDEDRFILLGMSAKPVATTKPKSESFPLAGRCRRSEHSTTRRPDHEKRIRLH